MAGVVTQQRNRRGQRHGTPEEWELRRNNNDSNSVEAIGK